MHIYVKNLLLLCPSLWLGCCVFCFFSRHTLFSYLTCNLLNLVAVVAYFKARNALAKWQWMEVFVLKPPAGRPARCLEWSSWSSWFCRQRAFRHQSSPRRRILHLLYIRATQFPLRLSSFSPFISLQIWLHSQQTKSFICSFGFVLQTFESNYTAVCSYPFRVDDDACNFLFLGHWQADRV